ncbi:hypothetical protein [Formosa undariae]|uniref:hypothetical protein n=1 Tax=Formosa undariae TaxID=1325436 RepID=UPI0036D2710D
MPVAISNIIEIISIILVNTLFLLIKESINGIKNNKGSNNTESPGKIRQLNGLSLLINKTNHNKINIVSIDMKFNVLLLFFIISVFY